MPTIFQIKHRRKLFVAVLLILGVCSIFAFRAGFQSFKAWRAKGLIEEARQFAKAGEWKEVSRAAGASFQNKESLEALRLLSTAAEKNKEARLLGLTYRLFLFPGATPTDRARALKLAYDSGDLENAKQLIASLTEADLKNADIHYQQVRGLLINRKFQEAITLADAATGEARDPSVDLLLAKQLALSGAEGAREATAARLRNAATNEDRELALEAMSVLVAFRDDWIEETIAEGLIKRFENDPKMTAAQQLQVQFLKIGLGQVTREEALDQATEKYRDTHLPTLIQWLERLGESARIVKLTEGDGVKLNAELFKVRLRALQGIGDWEQINEELENPPFFIAGPLLDATRAIGFASLNQRGKSLDCWRKAFEAAEQDSQINWFYHLADVAELLGNKELKMKAVSKAVLHYYGQLPDARKLEPLFEWLSNRRDGFNLYKISARLLRLNLNNPLLRNNFLYLKAVFDGTTPEDITAMREVVEKFPQEEAFRNSMAFLLLTSGDAEGAIAQLSTVTDDPFQMSNQARAIYAKALFDLGKEEMANSLAETIDWQDHMKEEQKALQFQSTKTPEN